MTRAVQRLKSKQLSQLPRISISRVKAKTRFRSHPLFCPVIAFTTYITNDQESRLLYSSCIRERLDLQVSRQQDLVTIHLEMR